MIASRFAALIHFSAGFLSYHGSFAISRGFLKGFFYFYFLCFSLQVFDFRVASIRIPPHTMTQPSTIASRFLTHPNQLGVVAVGFNGGQVRHVGSPSIILRMELTHISLQMKKGVEAAPMALIESGLLKDLHEDLDYDIHHDNTIHYYEKDIPAEDPDHRGMKQPRAVSAVTERLSAQVYNYAREGKFVLTLGGDHSIAIGTVSGTARAIRERLGREMAVIWVDAHADINVPEMSPSGNIHGMPMAFLTRLAREDKRDIFGWLKDEHIISTRKLVYIGLRDVDRGEKKLLRENGIKAFSMHDIDRYVFPSWGPSV